VSITVTIIGADRLIAKFANSPARQAQMLGAMDLVGAIIQGAVMEGTPVGVTSILRGSWQSDAKVSPLGFTASVGSGLVHAPVVEHGRSVGAPMPPPDALATWVARKLGPDVSPFVVARSIKRKGTKGVHMLETAVDRTRPAWGRVITVTASRLLERS
jgi:hypothetical protein